MNLMNELNLLDSAQAQAGMRSYDEATAAIEKVLDYIGDKTRGPSETKPAHWSRYRSTILENASNATQAGFKRLPKILPKVGAPYDQEEARKAAQETARLFVMAGDYGKALTSAWPGKGALYAVEKFVEEVNGNIAEHKRFAGYSAEPVRPVEAAVAEVREEKKKEEDRDSTPWRTYLFIGGGTLLAIGTIYLASKAVAADDNRY